MALKDLLSGIHHNEISFAKGGEVKGDEKEKCPDCGKEKCTCGKADGGKVEGAKAPKKDKTAQPGDKELTKGNEEKKEPKSKHTSDTLKHHGGSLPEGSSSTETEPDENTEKGVMETFSSGDSYADGDEVRGSEDASEGAGEVNEIDADSIIDAFLEENPDLAELPVEEWPEDAIKELQKVINSEGIDSPNGALPEDENEEGEPEGGSAIEALAGEEPAIEEETIVEEPTTDEPNDEQDFDIMELSKLVEAGDKDGAWDMLQDMFGVRPAAGEENAPTNALDRMVASDSRIKQPSNSSNNLAKLLGSLRF